MLGESEPTTHRFGPTVLAGRRGAAAGLALARRLPADVHELGRAQLGQADVAVRVRHALVAVRAVRGAVVHLGDGAQADHRRLALRPQAPDPAHPPGVPAVRRARLQGVVVLPQRLGRAHVTREACACALRRLRLELGLLLALPLGVLGEGGQLVLDRLAGLGGGLAHHDRVPAL